MTKRLVLHFIALFYCCAAESSHCDITKGSDHTVAATPWLLPPLSFTLTPVLLFRQSVCDSLKVLQTALRDVTGVASALWPRPVFGWKVRPSVSFEPDAANRGLLSVFWASTEFFFGDNQPKQRLNMDDYATFKMTRLILLPCKVAMMKRKLLLSVTPLIDGAANAPNRRRMEPLFWEGEGLISRII